MSTPLLLKDSLNIGNISYSLLVSDGLPQMQAYAKYEASIPRSY